MGKQSRFSQAVTQSILERVAPILRASAIFEDDSLARTMRHTAERKQQIDKYLAAKLRGEWFKSLFYAWWYSIDADAEEVKAYLWHVVWHLRSWCSKTQLTACQHALVGIFHSGLLLPLAQYLNSTSILGKVLWSVFSVFRRVTVYSPSWYEQLEDKHQRMSAWITKNKPSDVTVTASPSGGYQITQAEGIPISDSVLCEASNAHKATAWWQISKKAKLHEQYPFDIPKLSRAWDSYWVEQERDGCYALAMGQEYQEMKTTSVVGSHIMGEEPRSGWSEWVTTFNDVYTAVVDGVRSTLDLNAQILGSQERLMVLNVEGITHTIGEWYDAFRVRVIHAKESLEKLAKMHKSDNQFKARLTLINRLLKTTQAEFAEINSALQKCAAQDKQPLIWKNIVPHFEMLLNEQDAAWDALWPKILLMEGVAVDDVKRLIGLSKEVSSDLVPIVNFNDLQWKYEAFQAEAENLTPLVAMSGLAAGKLLEVKEQLKSFKKRALERAVHDAQTQPSKKKVVMTAVDAYFVALANKLTQQVDIWFQQAQQGKKPDKKTFIHKTRKLIREFYLELSSFVLSDAEDISAAKIKNLLMVQSLQLLVNSKIAYLTWLEEKLKSLPQPTELEGISCAQEENKKCLLEFLTRITSLPANATTDYAASSAYFKRQVQEYQQAFSENYGELVHVGAFSVENNQPWQIFSEKFSAFKSEIDEANRYLLEWDKRWADLKIRLPFRDHDTGKRARSLLVWAAPDHQRGGITKKISHHLMSQYRDELLKIIAKKSLEGAGNPELYGMDEYFEKLDDMLHAIIHFMEALSLLNHGAWNSPMTSEIVYLPSRESVMALECEFAEAAARRCIANLMPYSAERHLSLSFGLMCSETMMLIEDARSAFERRSAYEKMMRDKLGGIESDLIASEERQRTKDIMIQQLEEEVGKGAAGLKEKERQVAELADVLRSRGEKVDQILFDLNHSPTRSSSTASSGGSPNLGAVGSGNLFCHQWPMEISVVDDHAALHSNMKNPALLSPVE